MKNITTSFFLSIITFLSVNAQTKKLDSGNKQYDNLSYVDAIKTYERVAEKGYKSVELFEKLGNSYYFNGKLKEANKWYTELFALNEPVESEYYYRYSQTLKANNEYEKANKYLDMFHAKTDADLRGNIYENQKDYKEIIARNSGRYEVKPTDINSKVSDYGAAIYGDKLIFSSARDSVGFAKVQSKWTSQAFTNLYSADIKPDGSLEKAKRFSNILNSKFNESTPVFTKDLKTVYFTRNNFNNGKEGYDQDKKIALKIYKANLVDGKWVNIQELPFNSDNYSVAHPALSADEKTLYFASDMPGTKGLSDIFMVDILGENSYGTPKSLNGAINTEGRETFPYVTANNELYFSSDGHQGLGGLDVYATKLSGDTAILPITNVGAPVNGPMDDFAYLIDSSTKKGYFSSNRDGGKGFDDIYSFLEKTPLKFDFKQDLEGTITNSETGEILDNAKITLYDENFKPLQETTSDANGNYAFKVDPGKKYYVRGEKEDYETKEVAVVIPNEPGKTKVTLATNKKIKEIKVGSDLAKTFDIKIIYFDLDKSNIRNDAAVDLAKIVDVMKQYPNMKVDVRSHTDSRQTAKYNEKLSDKRAKATIAWMVKNGIEESRLSGKGYGESQLVNKCADGVKCTEQEHQQNRRSEFIIMAM